MRPNRLAWIASVATILGIVATAALRIGAVEGKIDARDKYIAELHNDIRELRDGWMRHLESHPPKTGQ